MAIGVPGGGDSKPKVLAQWGGLNTHADRAAIPESDFSWLENLFPIAPGNLRTLYAEGATLYTAGQTVISIYPYNLGATAYLALFLTDGSALQVRVSDAAVTTIGAAGTFYSGGTIPACSQYQSLYLIIGSDISANAYWVWDGTHLFGAGGLSPQVTVTAGGAAYASAPTITAFGGAGSGAAFTATVSNGQVTTVTCTNPGSGYALGDQPVLAFSGGGSDTDAIALPYVAQCSGVSSVAVTQMGSFANSTVTVAIAAPPAGVSATGTYDVVGGAVTNLVITAAGSGYWQGAPAVTAPGAHTVAAVITATINPATGAVSALNLISAGSGYVNGVGYALSITAAPTGVTATAVGTVTAIDATHFQLSAITVTNPGWGYVVPPVVTLSNTGAAVTAPTASANITRGQITTATLQQGGSGFTGNPAVIVSAPNDPAAVVTQTAVGVATIAAGAVTGVTLTTYGYGYTSASIDLRGGHNGADASVALMPFGVQATAIETYNNQVWTSANPATGPKMSFTASGSVSNFATSAGGGSAPATDSFLRSTLVAFKANEGFLYRLADSSCSVVGNVTTSTSGITTYNLSPVDTQIGTAWRDTACAFDRAIVFANTTGVYALFAGAIQKVSDELDQLFLTATFNTGGGGVTPTATVCTIFGIRCYCLLLTAKDYAGAQRTFLCCWNGKKWFIGSQTKTLTLVALQELNSVFTAWGTDGTRIFKLFQTASTGLTKTYQTRLDGAGLPDTTFRADNAYFVANLLNGSTASISMSTDTEKGTGNAQSFALVAGRQIVAKNVDPGGAVYGVLRGHTGTTTAADLQLIAIERLETDYSRQT